MPPGDYVSQPPPPPMGGRFRAKGFSYLSRTIGFAGVSYCRLLCPQHPLLVIQHVILHPTSIISVHLSSNANKNAFRSALSLHCLLTCTWYSPSNTFGPVSFVPWIKSNIFHPILPPTVFFQYLHAMYFVQLASDVFRPMICFVYIILKTTRLRYPTTFTQRISPNVPLPCCLPARR